MTGSIGMDLGVLRAHLAPWGVDVAGPLQAEIIAGGRSNLTYALTDGISRWVVRLPPPAGLTDSAHDMAREYRITSALHRVGIPVARPIGLCEDLSALGAPCTVAEWAEGIVLRDRQDLAIST